MQSLLSLCRLKIRLLFRLVIQHPINDGRIQDKSAGKLLLFQLSYDYVAATHRASNRMAWFATRNWLPMTGLAIRSLAVRACDTQSQQGCRNRFHWLFCYQNLAAIHKPGQEITGKAGHSVSITGSGILDSRLLASRSHSPINQ